MSHYQLVQTELFSGNGNKTVIIDCNDWASFMGQVSWFLFTNENLVKPTFAIRPELYYSNTTDLNKAAIWGVLVRDLAGQVTQHNGYCKLATQIINDIPCFDYAIIGKDM